jgi:DNA polymerase elongation subunit (family B)
MSRVASEEGFHDPLLGGSDDTPALVAVEHVEGDAGDAMECFLRRHDGVERVREPFTPFIPLVSDTLCDGPLKGLPCRRLDGAGEFRFLVEPPTWKSFQKAKAWLAKHTGVTAGNPGAPYIIIGDPVQQYLMRSGRTLFKGMPFDALRRMQVDIECLTGEGYEFCNAERESDRIIAIAMADSTGWHTVLSGAELDEAELLHQFVAAVRDRDPDVIEGHNIFNFDLPYLAERAKRHRLKLALGRDGSTPGIRPSRLSFGERTIAYTRFDLHGRHVVDTLFLVQAYDVTHRSLEGYGLKEVARHFGLAAADRTYIEGHAISAEFRRDPARVMRYAGHDVQETGALSRLLSQSAFVQAQLVPFSYQNIAVRGNATKIDALLVREYLRQGRALPFPDKARPFAGGYTDLFMEGVVRGVHHCDVRSLYPSLMLSRGIAPRSDELGVFLKMLEQLRRFRWTARDRSKQAHGAAERMHYEALQTTFKVLINSFYGYLGFDQARFSDFDAAERVTAAGRELLQSMIEWLRAHGAQPVEIDTDGIYFVPPADDAHGRAAFREAFTAWLPKGIEIEFDGDYTAMFSYKMKNYALLAADGEVTIKGAALKSRGLEPFQRQFLKELIRLKLEGRDGELPALKAQYGKAILKGEWPVQKLAKTETLQDSPATYAAKIGQGGRGRSAAYELALKSGREYRAGDQVSYYVTGFKKSVPVHASARLVAEWKPDQRDENVAYYVDKLNALYEKFCGGKLGGAEKDDE